MNATAAIPPVTTPAGSAGGPGDTRREDATLDRDVRAFYDALSELMRVYEFRDRDRICCHDVSVTQCYALEALSRRGALTLNELAAHLYLDKSTASRVVDALERKGYVARRPHPQDGRALQLEMTPAGRGLHDRIEAGIIEEERRLLAGFTPEVRQAMAQLLGRLARAAAASVTTGGGSCCRTT